MASDFDEEDLPLRGAVLELPTVTGKVFDRQRDVIDRSERSRRTIVALELEDQQLKRTEFRIRELGEFQIALQNVVTAVGQEMFGQPTVRGQVPKAIQEATRLVSTAEKLAASYVFFVSPDTDRNNALFEDPLASRAIEEVTDLIKVCGNQDAGALQEQIMTRSPRVRGRLLDLLKSLDSARSSLGLIAKGPSLREALETHLTWASVKVAQSLIEGAERMSAEVRVKRGVLLAYDTTSGSFKLTDLATTDEYRGKAEDDLRAGLQAGVNVGQGSLVSAILREEKVRGPHDAIEPRYYTMVDVEVIEG